MNPPATAIMFSAEELNNEAAQARACADALPGLVARFHAMGPTAREAVRLTEELHTALLEFADIPADRPRCVRVRVLNCLFLALGGARRPPPRSAAPSTAVPDPLRSSLLPDPTVHPPVSAQAVRWDDYPMLCSDDTVKSDLELVHTRCGTRLCDVEHGDSLSVLAGMVTDHDACCSRAARPDPTAARRDDTSTGSGR
ncbi:hypothetical protein [Kitasatospora sp. NPDC088783]|uniref:hypothetical protein n=1 Tax=Kitasatospora sp. NPDC088783 TaxID=3364077 RepID=UPI00382F1143